MRDTVNSPPCAPEVEKRTREGGGCAECTTAASDAKNSTKTRMEPTVAEVSGSGRAVDKVNRVNNKYPNRKFLYEYVGTVIDNLDTLISDEECEEYVPLSMEEDERIKQIAAKTAKEIADMLGRDAVDASIKSVGMDKIAKNDGKSKSNALERKAEKKERIAKAKEESRHTVTAIMDDIAKLTAESSDGTGILLDDQKAKTVGAVNWLVRPVINLSRKRK